MKPAKDAAKPRSAQEMKKDCEDMWERLYNGDFTVIDPALLPQRNALESELWPQRWKNSLLIGHLFEDFPTRMRDLRKSQARMDELNRQISRLDATSAQKRKKKIEALMAQRGCPPRR